MEKKQKTSLTWQLILTMVVIVAGTVAMCWFFNTTFLEKYYIFHKEKELKSSFDQVRLICEKQGDSSDDAYVQFERICANGNINMLIADQDRNLIWSSYSSAQRFQMQMEDWLYGSDRSRVQVLLSGKDYTLLRQTDERLQSEYLVLLGTLKNGNNLAKFNLEVNTPMFKELKKSLEELQYYLEHTIARANHNMIMIFQCNFINHNEHTILVIIGKIAQV